MFTGAKMIVKPEGQVADEFEQSVAQELFNLQVRCYTELLVQASSPYVQTRPCYQQLCYQLPP
jgi:hypothetical protein